MNREHWKAMAPLLAAYGEGKDLQFQMGDCTSWGDFDGGYPSPSNASIRWRIKTTPRLRPWKPEEVPVGAVVRLKKIPKIRILAAVEDTGEVIDGAGAKWRPETLLQNWTLLDGSPCGVEVTE